MKSILMAKETDRETEGERDTQREIGGGGSGDRQ